MKPDLDESCNRDNFILRRDRQKLRHGGLFSPTQFYTQSYSSNQNSQLEVIYLPLRAVCYKTVHKTLLS